jgi:hypothetical protein
MLVSGIVGVWITWISYGLYFASGHIRNWWLIQLRDLRTDNRHHLAERHAKGL